MIVHASVAPARVGLGDPFTLTVDASGTGSLSVPDGPFVEVRATHVSHSGGHTHVVKTLVCVDRGCAPDKTPRVVALRIGSSRVAVTIVPRVSAKAVSASRAGYLAPTSVPAVSSRLPLPAAGAFALVVAVALVVVAAIALRPRRGPASRRALRWDLPFALRLLRESAGRPAADRRRAADLVASLTHDADATRVAWAPPEPQPGDVAELADRVERSGSSR